MNKFAKVPEFKSGNNKEYEVEVIQDSAVYTKEADRHLPGLYYLVAWKSYPKEKNTWEPSSVVMHLQKMVSTFHKEGPPGVADSNISTPGLRSAYGQANNPAPRKAETRATDKTH